MSPGTRVAAFPRDELLKVLNDANPFTKEVLAEVSQRCMSMCRRVSEMAAGQVEQRLARMILDLAERNRTDGDHSSEPLTIPIRLTRQDLADLCGTSLETAIRIMSRWTKEKLIERFEDGIRILQPEALAQVCRQPVRRSRGTEL